MKLHRQLSMTKLGNAARELVVFMARTKLPMLAVGTAVAAKFRELWECLITRGGCATARACPADDYFRWSYEFSCTATPVNAFAVKCCRPRRLPPYVGGAQAREMTLASATPRDDEGQSSPEPELSSAPGAAGHEIDGLAEEFINRFREQLRMQAVA